MKRNEKILAGGLVALVVGYVGWPTVKSIYVEPIKELRGKVTRLETEVNDKQYSQVDLQVAKRQLTEWRKRGLPGDDLAAQRLYQEWITDLAVLSGLDPKVTPDPRRTQAKDVFTGVQVTLEGQATFKQLQSFVRRFHAVDLLHRVVNLEMTSPAAEGDPKLRYVLSAEGLTLVGAPDRDRIFPRTELKDALVATANELTLPAKEFRAKPGDLLRIGTELAKVTKIDGDLFALARAADGTTLAEHPAGTAVELFPVRRADSKQGGGVLALADPIPSPFVKPRKYDPRLDGFADQRLVRGETAKMTVKVADYDVEAGAPKIELADAPDGVTFDAATGELSWTPAAEVPNGDYKVSLVANVPAPAKRLEKTAVITIADANAPPVIEPVTAPDAFLGETVRVPIKATDTGPVTYKLDQGPEGAAVDASTGEFTWTVPKGFNPGDVTVTVSAADQGSPPQSATGTFKVTVRENLKPFVYLNGSIREVTGGTTRWEAWLGDRSSNRQMKLRESQKFEAAGVVGVIREIGPRHIIFERDGARWRMEVGQNLEEIKRIDGPPVAEAGSRKPVEADRPGEPPATAAPPAAAAADRPSAS